jgi:hypothetical protein
VTGGLSPRVLPMGEIRDLGGFAARACPAGGRQLSPQNVSYRDLPHLADLRAMGEGNALAARLRRPTGARSLLRAAEIYAPNLPPMPRRPHPRHLRDDLPDRLGARMTASKSRCAPVRQRPGWPMR